MGELLQEVRVAQTGVQILFGFLLTVPFAPGFARLNDAQRNLYAIDVLAVVLSMSFLVAPVAIHRVVFGTRKRPVLVSIAHVATVVGLLLLLVAVALGVLLVATVVFPAGSAGRVWLPGLATTGLVLCWIVAPLVVRSRSAYIGQEPSARVERPTNEEP